MHKYFLIASYDLVAKSIDDDIILLNYITKSFFNDPLARSSYRAPTVDSEMDVQLFLIFRIYIQQSFKR